MVGWWKRSHQGKDDVEFAQEKSGGARSEESQDVKSLPNERKVLGP